MPLGVRVRQHRSPLVVHQLAEGESQGRHIADDILRTLLKGNENARFVEVAGTVDQERRREKCFAATGGPTDKRRATGRDPAERQVIEAADTSGGF